MIDKHPAVVARCTSRDDVTVAVAFGREQGLPVAVRGGGHSAAGKGTCEGGIVIDLSLMNDVTVDPASRTARAQGGATWGQFDAATQAVGLATPGGVVSTTGIAGLALGGGFGWLTRRFGLSCDNLISVELTTAEGRHLVCSEDSHADLFCWSGDLDDGRQVIRPWLELGPPPIQFVDAIPYTAMQTLLDDLQPPGRRTYWKSGYLTELTDDAIRAGAAIAAEARSPFNLAEFVL